MADDVPKVLDDWGCLLSKWSLFTLLASVRQGSYTFWIHASCFCSHPSFWVHLRQVARAEARLDPAQCRTSWGSWLLMCWRFLKGAAGAAVPTWTMLGILDVPIELSLNDVQCCTFRVVGSMPTMSLCSQWGSPPPPVQTSRTEIQHQRDIYIYLTPHDTILSWVSPAGCPVLPELVSKYLITLTGICRYMDLSQGINSDFTLQTFLVLI